MSIAKQFKERRAHERFVLPWATLSYRKEGFFSKKEFSDDEFPIIDISRGGLRFLSMISIKDNTKLTFKILIPEEDIPLILKGRVRWKSVSPTRSFKYQIGIEFCPFDGTKGRNIPESRNRISELRQLYSEEKDKEPTWLK